ncbi:MAG: putative rane protein [Polyangiaceae bacterium]|jgi:cysteine-rich repeat protein|nr:putative rane protein [Polyangiaceae bacterium]
MKSLRDLRFLALTFAGAAACLSIDDRTVVDRPSGGNAGTNDGEAGSDSSGSGGTSSTAAGMSSGGGPSPGGEGSGGDAGTSAGGTSPGEGGTGGGSGEGGEPPILGPDCGDGSPNAGETCDDGNDTAKDGCTDCNVDPGYSCMGTPSVCATICGDGIVAGTEECDRASNVEPGCSAACKVNTGWGCWGEPSVCSRSCARLSQTACAGGSCCERDAIAGGSVKMGRGTETCIGCVDGCPAGTSCVDPEGVLDTPEHNRSINQYVLDRFEVTVGRFRRFVENYTTPTVGAGAHPAIAGTGWQSAWPIAATPAALRTNLNCTGTVWTTNPGMNEQLPVNCVNWYEAFAFCAWDGGRLPTETEWELAAAGGSENRVYPWGNEVAAATRALFNCPGGCANGTAANLANVGSKPNGAGRYGSRDLSGSLQEWVFDFYANYTTSFCNNCAATSGTWRVRRGGSWRSTVGEQLRAADRVVWELEGPGYRNDSSGFRCARTP